MKKYYGLIYQDGVCIGSAELNVLYDFTGSTPTVVVNRVEQIEEIFPNQDERIQFEALVIATIRTKGNMSACRIVYEKTNWGLFTCKKYVESLPK